MKIARSILGVFVGYVIFAASAVVLFHAAGRDPHAEQDLLFTAGAILYGIAFAAVGGLIAVRIAGRRPVLHAATVGVILAAGAFASLVSRRRGRGPGHKWQPFS